MVRGSRIASGDELTKLERCCVASSDASYGVSGSRWWAAQSSCAGSNREHFGIAPRGRLLSVSSADGAGASLAGEAATEACARAFARAADCPDVEPERWQLARRLLLSMRAARWALERRPRDPSLSVGLVAAATGGGHIAIARAGLAYAYRFRDGALTPLCHGGTTSDATPRRSGGALLEEPIIYVHDTQDGDAYLLCTSGVVAAVAEEEMRDRLMRSALPLSACNDLIRIARTRNPSRDATAVVLRLGAPMVAELGAAS